MDEDDAVSTLMINVLMEAQWKTPVEIADMASSSPPPVCYREALIDQLLQHCADSCSSLHQLSSEELAWNALVVLFLLKAQIQTADALTQLSLKEQRDVMLDETHHHFPDMSMAELRQKNNWELTVLGHDWWLPLHFQPLLQAMEDVTTKENAPPCTMAAKSPSSLSSLAVFGLKDNRGNSMDCLKVLPMDGSSYLGIYHTYSGSCFTLKLAKSTDLQWWTHVTDLDDHNHQGDIQPAWNGFLVANEESPPTGSGNNLRLRFYPTWESLQRNQAAHSVSLPRRFSNCAEGTPNICSITGTGPLQDSAIVLGFHFFRDCVVDRQAHGVLQNFSQWTAWKNEIANASVERHLGFGGNIGGRYRFEYNAGIRNDGCSNNNKAEEGPSSWCTILEAQQTPQNWSSWRLLLGNASFFTTLQPMTPKHSKSFANPCVVRLPQKDNNDRKSSFYIATTFLPSEGNGVGESGELLYQFAVHEV